MKLEVGMYVRTEWGIAKVIDFEAQDFLIRLDKKIMFENQPEYFNYTTIGNIIKASHNIIDLIEVGDYVNGLQVVEVREHLHNDKEIVLSNGEFNWSFSKNESDYEIKSIVTKECFESMSYKVGE